MSSSFGQEEAAAEHNIMTRDDDGDDDHADGDDANVVCGVKGLVNPS